MKPGPKPLQIEARLRASIAINENGCWLWQRTVSGCGYGTIKHAGKWLRAHRASYEAFVGSIPGGMMVCHSCDVPTCINPEHLFLGTAKDNLSDMARKGRSTRGEADGMAKLTASDVIAIRAATDSHREIADRHGISRSHVSLIRLRKTWRHIT